MAFCTKCGADVVDGARFCPSCGNTMPKAVPKKAAPQDPLVGKKLDGKFLIDELLGIGGMGRVYKAVQLSLDKPVCVKVLRTGMEQDETLAGRFHREARAASRLNHPNSITVIDFGQSSEDGSLYLAMEYVPGKDLGKVIHGEFPIGEKRIVAIMDQVLSALADAHAAGIVHRDLKPENIMVTDLRGTKDFVKVLDFGIAKIQESTADPGLTQAGMVCGTPEYMSPEQARGENLDARSDLYAAGVILYQMVTGKLPFMAPTAMGIVTKHLIEPPVPPSQVEGIVVSPALEAVVLKAMSKDRNGRQATALVLQQELAAVLSPKVAPAQQAPEGQNLFDEPTEPVPALGAGKPKPAPVSAEPEVAATNIRPATEDVRKERAGKKPAPAKIPTRRPAPVPEKKSGKGLLIAIVLIVVLGGGGAAAWFLFLKDRVGGEATDAGVEPTADAGVVAEVDAGAAPAVDAGAAVASADKGVQDKPDAGQVAIAPSKADEKSKPAVKVSEIAKMHYQAGKEHMAQQKFSKAIESFLRAVKNSPDFADAYRALGTCYISKGEIELATKNLRLYLKKKPDAEDREEIKEMIESFQ